MNNKTKQTSVEWLVDKLQHTRDWQRVINEANQSGTAVRDVIAEAKEMDKKQSENDWWAGFDEGVSGNMVHPSEDCNGYYNETYGGQE